MLKRMVLVLGMLLLPGAAMAQHAHEGKAHEGKAHEGKMDHAQMAKKHEGMVAFIMSQRADLQLTDEQYAKLQAYATRLSEHHKAEAAQKSDHGTQHAHKASDDAMHSDFMAIFTDAQKEKVHALMKQQMNCHMTEEKQCKMHPAKPGGEHKH